MVNFGEPVEKKKLPSVTEILDKFQAEQSGTGPIAPPATTSANGTGATGFETVSSSVFDRLADLVSWADILEPVGWIQVSPPDTATLEAWRRPGGTHPVSAKVLKANPHVVVVHSEDAGLPSGAGQKLTKPRLLAHLHYRGDESAFAKDLIRGEAIGAPAHINAAFAAEWVNSGADQGHQKADQGQAGPDYEAVFAEEVEREARKLEVRELGKERWHARKYGTVELPDFKSLDEFLAEDDEDEKSVIPGLWAKDTPILFAAQYKAGKTTVRDNVVKVLADGGKLFGQFSTAPYPDGRIVILDLELAEHMLRGWLRDHGILKSDRVVVVPMRGRGASLNLTNRQVRARWAERLKQWEAGVLILDCLRPVLDGLGLNEHSEAGRFLNSGFDPLLYEAGGVQGMVIQHMGHNGERARGDSSMLGWGDSWRLLRKDSDDPGSPRFFTGYGRFGDVEESELAYDQRTRTLSIVGGSRKQTVMEHHLWIIKGYIEENPGCSQAQVIDAFSKKKDQTRYEPIAALAVRAAIKLGISTRQLDPGHSPKGQAMKLTVSDPITVLGRTQPNEPDNHA